MKENKKVKPFNTDLELEQLNIDEVVDLKRLRKIAEYWKNKCSHTGEAGLEAVEKAKEDPINLKDLPDELWQQTM